MRHLIRFICARMSPWLFVSLALLVAIAVTAPRLLPVSLYKLSLITCAAWVAYWIDRGLFPYARPDAFMAVVCSPGAGITVKSVPKELPQALGFAAAQLRRAVIIAAAMIGVALGA